MCFQIWDLEFAARIRLLLPLYVKVAPNVLKKSARGLFIAKKVILKKFQGGHDSVFLQNSSLTVMIRTEQYWDDELGAPILERNYNFVTTANQEELHSRVKGWMKLLEVDSQEFDLEKLRSTPISKETLRILRKDAERTYVSKDNKEVDARTKARQDMHVDSLKLVVAEIQDYHQGLGYIAAFLGIFLDVEDVAKLALCLHRSPNHSAGYFKGAPQRFVADAKVFYKILAAKNPTLHQHLSSKGVLPEMFVVKYFVGLSLHVLPFSALLEFYENFFAHGNDYLFKFALKYIETFQEELMAARTTADVMTILRAEDSRANWRLPQVLLKRHINEDVFSEIVRGAMTVELDSEHQAMRELEAKAVAAAVEAARKRDEELKAMYSDDEIEFSDEDEDDE